MPNVALTHVKEAEEWDGYGAEHKTVGISKIGSNLGTGWHLYAMDWRANSQNSYYDGVLASAQGL